MRALTFLAIVAAIVVALPAVTAAGPFEPGDIVVPGDRIVDGWGSRNGCFYRVRGGEVTRWFQTELFRSPQDMVVDAQGRLVFWAAPYSRNWNDAALFRLDPETGTYERLFYFPYMVAAGDTLPDGADDATSFYGTLHQSLHFEKSLSIAIVDDENGGWPQVSNDECYGFSIGTADASGSMPSTYRYRAASGRCETGIAAPLPWTGAPYMTDDGTHVYYGMGNLVGRTKAAAKVRLELDGDWGSFGASLTVNPKNEIIVDGTVFDNTEFANNTATCGPLEDNDVPYSAPHWAFSVLSMNGLGVLDGSLYAISSSGATGVPYVFDLAMRGPFLNPYSCTYFTASHGSGPIAFWLEDGTATGSTYTSADADGLLGTAGGVLKRVTRSGGFTQLMATSGESQFTGRPHRWSSSSSAVASQAAPAPSAVANAGSQVLVVRADAGVHVLLTDPQGLRVGFDAAGAEINDLGDRAALATGPGGWPRVIVLRDPDAGTFAAELAGVEAGDWDVKAYLAHEDAGGVLRATSLSSAGSGSEVRGLHVGQPLELTWYASPAGVGDDAGVAGFVSVGPVPSRGAVRFAYRVSEPDARVRLEIFDLLGRRVAMPVDQRAAAGTHSLAWDGMDAHGQRLARGVYVARLDTGSHCDTRRIVLTD